VDHSGVNAESHGEVIRQTRNIYEIAINKREIAEWVTRVVDDRMISSNSDE
jgi:hypothetical protein